MFPQNEVLPFLTTDVRNLSVELMNDYFTGVIEYTHTLFNVRLAGQFSSCVLFVCCLFYLLQNPEIRNLTFHFGCFLYVKWITL